MYVLLPCNPHLPEGAPMGPELTAEVLLTAFLHAEEICFWAAIRLYAKAIPINGETTEAFCALLETSDYVRWVRAILRFLLESAEADVEGADIGTASRRNRP